MAARVIAVVQQKGGVGKSTTVVELACAWGVHGVRARHVAPVNFAHGHQTREPPSRVLVIVVDAQAGATRKLGIDPDEITAEESVIAALADPAHRLEQSIWREVYAGYGVDVCPAHFDLEATEAQLAASHTPLSALRDTLDTIREDYDYVLLDSRPSLGMLTLQVLFAADELLIPVRMADTECLNGVRQVIGALAEASEAGREIELLGAVATFHDARKQRVADTIRRYVTENLGVPFMRTVIPDRSHFANAALDGVGSVNIWRPKLDAASSYRYLAMEIAERAQQPAHG